MVVTYQCHIGPNGKKLFDLVGEKSIYCTSKDNRVGIWSNPPPQCINLVKCPIPEVENGIMESGFKHSFSLNDTVMFKCKPGFTMKGSNIVWCQPNNTWNPSLPKCFKGELGWKFGDLEIKWDFWRKRYMMAMRRGGERSYMWLGILVKDFESKL